jgi:hypothetical protein
MAGRIAYYGNTVTNGLVLSLDAAKRDSYPGSGTVWRDISGNGNNGTLTNGPTFNSDNGGSIVFDGVDDYTGIIQSSSYQFSNTSPFTISAWINPVTSSDYNIIAAYALYSGNFRGYYFGLISTASVYYNDNFVQRQNSFIFDYYDGTSFRGIMGNSNTVTFGSWVMLTATTSTNSVNDMKVYQNGILTSYVNRGTGTPNSIDYTGVPLRIGIRETGAIYKGNISTVQIYNRALSQQEVQQNYNAQKSRYGL